MLMSESMSTPRRSSYSTINTTADTLALVDQCRAALRQTSGKLSRAALVAAAVEHYAASLADEGHPVDAVDVDQLTDLSGTKIPFRPRADWAIIDTTVPPRVQLATGRGPRGNTVLTVVAEILPHLTHGGHYGSARAMLDLAGYAVDNDRDTDVMPDGRELLPITTN